MAPKFLIVDGYNLLHAAGLSQARYAPRDLKRQRHRLLVRLARELSDAERLRCTVVFDAKEAPSGLDRQMSHAEMTVMFAKPGHDADTLIEELIEAHPLPRELVVVSSDHRLQKAAQHRHAEAVGSDQFLAGLASRAKEAAKVKEPTKPVKKDQGPTAEDVAAWMAEFGEIDVDAIARSEEPEIKADPWQQRVDELQKRLDDGRLDDWLNEER